MFAKAFKIGVAPITQLRTRIINNSNISGMSHNVEK